MTQISVLHIIQFYLGGIRPVVGVVGVGDESSVTELIFSLKLKHYRWRSDETQLQLLEVIATYLFTYITTLQCEYYSLILDKRKN